MARHPLMTKWQCSVKHNTTFKSFDEFKVWCLLNGWCNGDYVIRRFSKLPFDKENTVISKRESNVKRVFNGNVLEGRVIGNLRITRKHARSTRDKPVVWAYCKLCHSEKPYSMKWLYHQSNPNCGCVEKDYSVCNKKWTPSELQSVKDAIMAKPEQSVISVCREIAPQYGVSAEKVYATYNRMSKKGWKL